MLTKRGRLTYTSWTTAPDGVRHGIWNALVVLAGTAAGGASSVTATNAAMKPARKRKTLDSMGGAIAKKQKPPETRQAAMDTTAHYMCQEGSGGSTASTAATDATCHGHCMNRFAAGFAAGFVAGFAANRAAAIATAAARKRRTPKLIPAIGGDPNHGNRV